jgi:hypothetical protein
MNLIPEIPEENYFLEIEAKVMQSLYRPSTGPNRSSRLRLPHFEKINTRRR